MFKSEAQRRKFQEFVKSGTMTQAIYDEWDKKTTKKLSERLRPKQHKTVRSIKRGIK